MQHRGGLLIKSRSVHKEARPILLIAIIQFGENGERNLANQLRPKRTPKGRVGLVCLVKVRPTEEFGLSFLDQPTKVTK